MCNFGSSIGTSVVVSLLARNTQINHAQLTSPTTLALLDAEVTRQAMLTSYLNDFRLMMFICLAVIPLLRLLPRLAAA